LHRELPLTFTFQKNLECFCVVNEISREFFSFFFASVFLSLLRERKRLIVIKVPQRKIHCALHLQCIKRRWSVRRFPYGHLVTT